MVCVKLLSACAYASTLSKTNIPHELNAEMGRTISVGASVAFGRKKGYPEDGSYAPWIDLLKRSVRLCHKPSAVARVSPACWPVRCWNHK
jgi:hypothetical protein